MYGNISLSLHCTSPGVRAHTCLRVVCQVRHYGSKRLNNLPRTLFSNAIL